MKKLLLLSVSVLFIAACTQDAGVSTEENSKDYLQENQERANNKVDVCHNGHIINVNVKAIPAHQAHGDAMDLDGDGYFNAPNSCSDLVEDCDDDASINPGMEEICDDGIDNNCDGQVDEGCCPDPETYCGFITYFDVEVFFNGDCTVDVVFNNTPCDPGATWTLLTAQGNVYTYIETDPCGISGCIVTVTDNGGSLDVSYECDPQGNVASGTVVVCN
ncbi:putative metal-binding protein [Ulvibacter sp. MAR_2010_11]|uniref:putative metal-binding motif-containing protein n=1 Tax=Ulvibacter sp. MAR_2010_11 TaxID=1250229 RepID=UPI000C2C9628|nr:putative metal-binding motif-containing protein [Ulvibacter sp. MAR_2010_11]PKA84411.1 putative metal-binding protein [Ulvibacter sp. MAR_2010_11]